MWTSPIAYVRARYSVPAQRGMRVVMDGQPGVITGACGGFVRVRFDDARRSAPCHPTWRMTYLDINGHTLWQSQENDRD